MTILHVGTSGYSYKPWKGPFYPADLPDKEMLQFYAGKFDTVEINNTFYRMPAPPLLEGWRDKVPQSFSFILKAPQRITHSKSLVDKGPDVEHFFDVARTLGPLFGGALFQLPPYARKDAEKLRAFLSLIPGDARAALEVRHDSWLDEEIYAILRERNVPLCLSDTDDSPPDGAPLVITSDWGYLRLRRTEYSDSLLTTWHTRLAATGWSDAYVFFKHEDEGRGPDFAKRFLRLAGE